MADYYNEHHGDLYPGHVAKSSDIVQIQTNTRDAIRNAVKDSTESESWILGSDENAFILTPDKKREGRYIDQRNLAEGDDREIVSIRQTSYRQPIKLSRSSVYSIIVELQNKSETDVPIVFELQDENGQLIPNMKTVVTLKKNTTTPKPYEIVFDLKYYPTAYNIDPEELELNNSSLVNKNNPDQSSDERGVNYTGEKKIESFSAGASVLYFVVEALNRNRQQAFDINTKEGEYQWNDTDPTFGIVMNKNSQYGQLLEENSGSGYIESTIRGDLCFKEIYANSPTYQCQPGQAIIAGQKVLLADTHVSIGGASSAGNVISYVYMDDKGHLKAENSEPFWGDTHEPIPISEPHLHIANITTYLGDVKDPIVEQSDENQITRPRSHHERLRRLEKKMSYTQDLAIPQRLEYTITEDDWIDSNPETDMTYTAYDGAEAQKIDALKPGEYVTTTDANGNFIVKLTKAESLSIPITLKSETSGKISSESTKTKVISTAQDKKTINELESSDILRAQTFAEIKNMTNDVTNGTLSLSTTDSGIIVATSNKEAKQTELNPWDDDQANRPASSKITPTTRAYTVTSGKNGSDDWESEFPAMTFYTDKGYTLKKIQIPIYKFKNCTGIKFYIWRRQGPNDQDNTVWFEERMWTTKTYSLKNAKVKNGYQYMENGFIIDFGTNGLSLSSGQYVIVCLPIVESGQGTVYVDTYKPKKSKDFCIRYYGAANASHFLLKERYHEIWYNPVKAQIEDSKYSKSGSVTSGVVSWENKEPIKTVKPILNLTKKPKNTEVKVFVDVGGGWKEMTVNKANNVIGSGNGESFRWKLEFTGDTTTTPILKYNKNKKYAMTFEINRAEPQTVDAEQAKDLDKNLCFTSKPFDAHEILRDYVGDMNFALNEDKFSNYEFARVWATDNEAPMIIDISASDEKKPVIENGVQKKTDEGRNIYYPVYSFHYADLKLEDIPHTSINYSNYDPALEDDEHNLRFKIDTENSYNDNDIRVINSDDFKVTNPEYEISDEDTSTLKIDMSKIVTSNENENKKNLCFAKARFETPLDLSKYSALKLGLTLNGANDSSISGLGLYISSQYEVDVPTNIPPTDMLDATQDGLPDLNISQEEILEKYANKVIYDIIDDNGSAVHVYYRCVLDSSSETEKWKWEQVHNVNSYSLFEIIDRSTKSSQLNVTNDNKNKEQFYEFTIDPQNINFQKTKEIGFIVLDDEGKYVNNNVTELKISSFKAIKNDYYSVFKASEGNVFVADTEDVTCAKSGSLSIANSSNPNKPYTKTSPETSSVSIDYNSISKKMDLCSFDMTSKSVENFNHIGISLAADCLLVKNMLELQLRKVNKDGTEKTIETLNLPTTNYVYYSTTAEAIINTVQIVKKIKTTEKFDKIVLVATDNFKKYAKKLKGVDDNHPNGKYGSKINLYIRDIKLYRANTFPMMYPTIRMKFYPDKKDSESSGIRKIGAVIEY